MWTEKQWTGLIENTQIRNRELIKERPRIDVKAISTAEEQDLLGTYFGKSDSTGPKLGFQLPLMGNNRSIVCM